MIASRKVGQPPIDRRDALEGLIRINGEFRLPGGRCFLVVQTQIEISTWRAAAAIGCDKRRRKPFS